MESWYKTTIAQALKATTRIRHLRREGTLVGTVATIKLDDGRYAVGVTECSEKDQPSKAIGKEIASGRALYGAAVATGLVTAIRSVSRTHHCPYGGPRQNRTILTENELETFYELLTATNQPLNCLSTILNTRIVAGMEKQETATWFKKALGLMDEKIAALIA